MRVGTTNKVLASRDGDRFHYYWAARRALMLLDPATSLRAVAIEGLPKGEQVARDEVVDVAEYYGAANAADATSFRHIQLKHSTYRTGEPVMASELETTLTKFASMYRGFSAQQRAKVTYQYVCNRSLHEKVRTSLQELAVLAGPRTHADTVRTLRTYLGFDNDLATEAQFCQQFVVDDGVTGLASTERLLEQDLRDYLPGLGNKAGMALLLEAVSRRATTLEPNQVMVKADVLAAFGTTNEDLFPAPNGIEHLDAPIRTANVKVAADAIEADVNRKMLLTATGGIGKSVLTTLLPAALPSESVTLVYDCFAGGDYRHGRRPRHDHRTALTQLANELAGHGLCPPLVPSEATNASYLTTFMRRVERSATQLAADAPEALLTIVIDAADNAAMEARARYQDTFVTDLLREDWPANVRLVMLCRPERAHLLNPPAEGVSVHSLDGFSKAETLLYLRATFPEATNDDGASFHALSSGNPRVQAMALENQTTVAEAIHAIQVAVRQPGETLSAMLQAQVADLADKGHFTPDELAALGEALAALPPPIPIDVVAHLTGLSPDLVTSFAHSVGRGVHTQHNALQFRDEPTETWFRTTYEPMAARRQHIVRTVTPMATTSVYVATALPQLLLDAGMLSELVELALSDTALPTGLTEFQVQEVARSRARYALSAMLRTGLNKEAALVAVKAGTLTSGHTRRLQLFRSNPDLVARFLGPDLVEELCTSRELATRWPGSNLHLEAAVLSHLPQFHDLALARFTSAVHNMAALTRLPETDQARRQDFTQRDVADLALAALNIKGPPGAVEFMNRWHPRSYTRGVAAALTVRLAEVGRGQEINDLIFAGKSNKNIQRAAATTLFDYNIAPTKRSVKALIKLLTRRTKPFTNRHGERSTDLRAVTWTLVHALRTGQLDDQEALRILEIHLEPHLPDSATMGLDGNAGLSLLTAYALRAHLTRTALSADTVASPTMAKRLHDRKSNPGVRRDYATDRFTKFVSPTLPWVQAWVATILNTQTHTASPELTALFDADLQPVRTDDPPFEFLNTVADIATRVLSIVTDPVLVERFTSWHATADVPLSGSRLRVARTAARTTHMHPFALDVVNRGVHAAQAEQGDGDSRIDTLTALARTILTSHPDDSDALFAQAVAEADLIGDDLYDRWNALLNTCSALGTGTEEHRAQQLAAMAENLHRYGSVHEHELAGHLRAMHEPTFLATASQARDRNTLGFDRLLEGAIDHATRSPASPSLLALHAFTRYSNWRQALSTIPEPQRSTAEAALTAYTGPTSTNTASLNTDDRWRPKAAEPAADDSSSDHWSKADFTRATGWQQAITDTRWGSPDRDLLGTTALAAHPTARPAVLQALTDCEAATVDVIAHVADAAAQLPPTPALQRALAAMARRTATRFAPDLCTRHGIAEDLALLASASGVSQVELTRAALRELGNHAHDLRHRDLFAVAAQLANTLDPVAAGEVFDALTPMFDELAPEQTEPATTGLTARIRPPDDVAACTAGLIWAALGDVSGRVRWQGAHAVLLLYRLGCNAELAALAGFADGTHSVDPFIEPRFPFYAQHSRMWLLMALSRIGLEPAPDHLTPFHTWLAHVVLDTKHAVNQPLAQGILQRLHSHRADLGARSGDALAAQLSPRTETMSYGEHLERKSHVRTQDDDDFDPDRFFFDFQKYWCGDLADVFGLRSRDIAQRASTAAATFPEHTMFRDGDDPRHDADIYESGSTWSDQHRWPRQERLGFYLGVHGLLVAGAELAVDHVAFRDPEAETHSYSDWLAQYLPKRPDGRWLDDRRDPRPPTTPPMQTVDRVDWPWTIQRSYFDLVVAKDQEWVTVWANTHDIDDDRRQDVHVESALVSPTTATGLLHTLQHWPDSPSPAGYLPTTDLHERDKRGKAPFDLLAWVDNTFREGGIDHLDERAGGVRFPPPRPGAGITERFTLTTDDDERVWYLNGTPVLRSHVWGASSSDANDSGSRLEAHRDFITRLLSELERTMVIQVRIDRDFDYSSYRRRKDLDVEFNYLPHSGRTYLRDAEGNWRES